jgi:hypothetical protein
MKKHIDLSIDEMLWKEYQKLCIDQSKIPSHEIEKFMRKRLKLKIN